MIVDFRRQGKSLSSYFLEKLHRLYESNTSGINSTEWRVKRLTFKSAPVSVISTQGYAAAKYLIFKEWKEKFHW